MRGHEVRLVDVVATKANNFDVLRLAAAFAVLFIHCFPLTGSSVPNLAGLAAPLEQGVPVFFAISGFLIARSWLSEPTLITYAAKRALRLIPALVIAALFTSFVIGPAFTNLPLLAYLTDPTPYIYALRCSILIPFQGTLPGVFVDNPYPNAVNGSLWTLPVEATAYAIIGLLGGLGLLLRRWGAATSFLIALLLASPLINLDALISVNTINAAGEVGAGRIMTLFAIFLGGSLLYVCRERIVLNWWIAAAAAAIWYSASGSVWINTVGPLTIPYLVLVGAYRTPKSWRRLTRHGDFSYGVYIYAFPLQQAVAATWLGVSTAGMFLIAAPLAYIAGAASWRLIERPTLALKSRLPRKTLR
jgi:peptidoglycan/LPS O-acetylase OafA/YrhL